jgi:acyl-CoA thioester hydrolase
MIHTTRLRVRSYECDGYGHVNNANYLHYLEVARGEYLEAVGLDYKDMTARGYGLYVAKICIEYKSPAFPADDLSITSETVKSGRVSGTLRQVVLRGQQTLARAEVDWGFVGPPVGQPGCPEFDLTGWPSRRTPPLS